MSIYEAIIFDLDGTAISSEPNAVPSDKVVKAVEDAQKSMHLCAATGRSITNSKYLLDALKLNSPCVISAGTQIVNPKTEEILWEATIDEKDVESVLEVCKPYNFEILSGTELVGEGAAAAERKPHTTNVLYIMAVSKTDAEVISKALSGIKGISSSEVPSWVEHGVDIHITNKEATKEHAVEKLLDIIGVDKDKVIGVGDADNDVHLFKSVGHKVAMGNATDRLKKLADEVAPSVTEDGLAAIIQKYST